MYKYRIDENNRCTLKLFSINQFNYYTPRQRSRGSILVSPCAAYVCVSVLLSVRPSVSLSVSVCPPSVDMILSTHVLRNRCMDFSDLYIDYSPSADVHLEFSYWMDNFSLFYRLFLLLETWLFFYNNKFITRKTCSVLNLEILKMSCCWTATLYLLLRFTIFLKICANFHSVN